MPPRKPGHQKYESFVEQLIREAHEAGEFDNLPGFGKPFDDLGDLGDELWWVKRLLRREQLSALPPSLAIKVDVHKTMEQIRTMRAESDVRRAIVALNERIAKANRSTGGPPSTTMPVDVERAVQNWKENRTKNV